MGRPPVVTLSIESDEMYRIIRAITEVRAKLALFGYMEELAGEDLTLEQFCNGASELLLDKMGSEWIKEINQRFIE